MAKWLITEKNSNQRHCKSLKGQGHFADDNQSIMSQ